jgi:hypothetical protein
MIRACGVGPLSARVDGHDQREATEEELSLRVGDLFSCLPTV